MTGISVHDFEVSADVARLRAFADAIGETRPLYLDEAAKIADQDDGALRLPPIARDTLERFGITRLGEAPVCRGRALPDAGDGLQRFALRVDSAGGEARLRGEALSAACPSPPPLSRLRQRGTLDAKDARHA